MFCEEGRVKRLCFMSLLRVDIKWHMILRHTCPMCSIYNTSSLRKGLGSLPRRRLQSANDLFSKLLGLIKVAYYMSLFPREAHNIEWPLPTPPPLPPPEKLNCHGNRQKRMSDVLLGGMLKDVKIQTYEEDVGVRLHSRQTTSPCRGLDAWWGPACLASPEQRT